MAKIEDIISPSFFDDVATDDYAEGRGIPLNACVVVEYLEPDGTHMLACSWTDDMTYYQREGMIRDLLRNALMVPTAAERREGERQLDELIDGDD